MVFIAGVFFLFLRAEMCKVKGRKLAEKKPVFSEKIWKNFRKTGKYIIVKGWRK